MDLVGIPLIIELGPGQLYRNAGLLPLRQFSQRMGLTRALVPARDDPRRRRPHESPVVDGFGPDELATIWQQHWRCQPNAATTFLAEER
jgi:hypothetical protein